MMLWWLEVAIRSNQAVLGYKPAWKVEGACSDQTLVRGKSEMNDEPRF